ncbi:MAG: apolipoprotein N-acyltransferase [Legionellales bacterium]
MKQAALTNAIVLDAPIQVNTKELCKNNCLIFLAGLLGPLGFAPFHLPGFTILSIAILFSGLLNSNVKQGFFLGLSFGLGYFGFGVSWVIISIHDYGQLNYFFAGVITLLFISYLSLFPALVAAAFNLLKIKQRHFLAMGSFSALWCLSECIRSNLMTGFPWLLVGTTQIDTPLRSLAPIIGIYGLSFCCTFAAALLALTVRECSFKRYYYLVAFVVLLLFPSVFKNMQWTDVKKQPITVGAIQANLSMRDKWDETLFWNLLNYYEKATDKLLGKQLIILPESAIPLPARYLNDYLSNLDNKALKAKSALMLGILQPTDDNEVNYYNSIITLGQASGQQVKRQLVPFGEYIPKPFVAINRWFHLPEPNILPGAQKQPLIKILNHPIASLICYEIAYPYWLRQQLPDAQWIVSISDNGWFGRSLASYQQLQISQMLSLLTGRYQIVVNNDGLSSVINANGDIVEALPSFSAGLLQSAVFPAVGATPWVIWYDYPILVFCLVFLIFVRLFR